MASESKSGSRCQWCRYAGLLAMAAAWCVVIGAMLRVVWLLFYTGWSLTDRLIVKAILFFN
jgi:hypothetical protein